jgi:hypothetical protein
MILVESDMEEYSSVEDSFPIELSVMAADAYNFCIVVLFPAKLLWKNL